MPKKESYDWIVLAAASDYSNVAVYKCKRCGYVQEPHKFPVPVDIFSKHMKAFIDIHKDCKEVQS